MKKMAISLFALFIIACGDPTYRGTQQTDTNNNTNNDACTEDDDCDDGAFCHVDGECMGGDADNNASTNNDTDGCESNDDCEDGQACASDGTCRDLSDNNDDGCESNKDCEDGQACASDGTCRDLNNPECTSDDDCAANEVCDDDGKCEPKRVDIECTEDNDCSGDEVCESYMCVAPDPECTSDNDCSGDEVCEDNVCEVPTSGCTEDSDCDDGEVCLSDGMCRPVTQDGFVVFETDGGDATCGDLIIDFDRSFTKLTFWAEHLKADDIAFQSKHFEETRTLQECKDLGQCSDDVNGINGMTYRICKNDLDRMRLNIDGCDNNGCGNWVCYGHETTNGGQMINVTSIGFEYDDASWPIEPMTKPGSTDPADGCSLMATAP